MQPAIIGRCLACILAACVGCLRVQNGQAILSAGHLAERVCSLVLERVVNGCGSEAVNSQRFESNTQDNRRVF